MNQKLLPEIKKLTGTVFNVPSVTLILPFEPQMKSKKELAFCLETAIGKVKRKLFENFPFEMALLVMQRLSSIIKELNFSTNKKSIAIYVSPVFEKVLYLNMEVDERVSVDKSFHIRDLVKSKTQLHQYLLLQLTENECRIYVNESGEMQKIFFSSLENFLNYADPLNNSYQNNFNGSACESTKEEKFLRRIDNSLDFILETYHLPLLIMGNENMLNQFDKITTHCSTVVENIKSDYKDAVIEEIKNIIGPYIADWKKLKQKFLSNQLQTAAIKKKLASGLNDVYMAVKNHNCRLLVVEENYKYPATDENNGKMEETTTKSYSRFSYLKDTVDEIIEKILEENGDVEFVSKNIMGHYNHVALILHSKKNSLYENNYPGD